MTKDNECSLELSGLLQNIMANAFDYAGVAADEYVLSRSDSGKLKYAVLHLWSSIQLLLKCRIIFSDWKRVLNDRKKEEPQFLLFRDGNYKTKYYAALVAELKSILESKSDSYDEDLLEQINKYNSDLDALQNLRNKLEHFTCALDPETFEPTIANVWQFVTVAGSVISDKILSNIPFSELSLYDKWNAIKKRIAEDDLYSERRLKEIQSQINTYEENGVVLIRCYNCRHFAIPVNDCIEPCLFCKMPGDGACFFEIWWENETNGCLTKQGIPEGHPWNAGMCPNCEERGYYVMTDAAGSIPADVLTLCFSCGYATRKK